MWLSHRPGANKALPLWPHPLHNEGYPHNKGYPYTLRVTLIPSGLPSCPQGYPHALRVTLMPSGLPSSVDQADHNPTPVLPTMHPPPYCLTKHPLTSDSCPSCLCVHTAQMSSEATSLHRQIETQCRQLVAHFASHATACKAFDLVLAERMRGRTMRGPEQDPWATEACLVQVGVRTMRDCCELPVGSGSIRSLSGADSRCGRVQVQ